MLAVEAVSGTSGRKSSWYLLTDILTIVEANMRSYYESLNTKKIAALAAVTVLRNHFGDKYKYLIYSYDGGGDQNDLIGTVFGNKDPEFEHMDLTEERGYIDAESVTPTRELREAMEAIEDYVWMIIPSGDGDAVYGTVVFDIKHSKLVTHDSVSVTDWDQTSSDYDLFDVQGEE